LHGRWEVRSLLEGAILCGVYKQRFYGLAKEFEAVLAAEYDLAEDHQEQYPLQQLCGPFDPAVFGP
jgi:hypothetical protein